MSLENVKLAWKQSTFTGPHTPIYFVESPFKAEISKPVLKIELNLFASSRKDAWTITILGIRSVTRNGGIKDYVLIQMYAEAMLRSTLKNLSALFNQEHHEQHEQSSGEDIFHAH